jgi:hypothetical protein
MPTKQLKRGVYKFTWLFLPPIVAVWVFTAAGYTFFYAFLFLSVVPAISTIYFFYLNLTYIQ